MNKNDIEIFGNTKETVNINGNDYNKVSIRQVPVGNFHETEDISEFINYYMLNNFVYIMFSKLKYGFMHKYNAQAVVDNISNKLGDVYLNLSKHFEQPTPDILDINFSIVNRNGKDISANDYKNFFIRFSRVPVHDIDEISKDTEVYILLSDKEDENALAVCISSALKTYIEDLYSKIVEKGEFPSNISCFYYDWLEYYNPFKRIVKPYIIDVGYIKNNIEDITKYCESKSGASSLTDTIKNKSYWEEMATKAAAIAHFNSTREFKLDGQSTINNEIHSLFKSTDIGDEAANIIANIFQLGIANKYRIIFILNLKEVLTEEQYKIWKSIMKVCTKKYRTSVYSFN